MSSPHVHYYPSICDIPSTLSMHAPWLCIFYYAHKLNKVRMLHNAHKVRRVRRVHRAHGVHRVPMAHKLGCLRLLCGLHRLLRLHRPYAIHRRYTLCNLHNQHALNSLNSQVRHIGNTGHEDYINQQGTYYTQVQWVHQICEIHWIYTMCWQRS